MLDERDLSKDVRPDNISDVDSEFGNFKRIVGSDVPAPDDSTGEIEDLLSQHMNATGQSKEDFLRRMQGGGKLTSDE